MSVIELLQKTKPQVYSRKPDRAAMLNLSSNTLMHPMLSNLHQRFLQSLHEFGTYPYYETLKETFSALYQLSCEQIVFTAGSDHLIAFLMQAAKQLGLPQIILQQPFYYNYANYAERVGLPTVCIEFENLFTQPTIEGLKHMSPSFIFLISPCPITGEVLALKDLELWIQEVNGSGHFVILDQAYAGFGSPLYDSLVKKHAGFLLFQTFSKCYGAAGLRFSVALGNTNLMAYIRNAGIENTISSIAIHYARFVLQYLTEFTALQNDIVVWRQQAYDVVCNDFPTLHAYNSMANFISLSIEEKTLEQLITLAQANLVFLKKHFARGGSCLRVTVTQPSVMQQLYNLLTQVIKS